MPSPSSRKKSPSNPNSSPLLSTYKPRAVVVGGGISGLGSAHELSKQGFDVLLLEATNRLGGRLFSVKGWPITSAHAMREQHLELCASWFHATDKNLLFQYVKDLIDKGHIQLNLTETAFHFTEPFHKFKSMIIFGSDNQPLTPAQKNRLLKLAKKFNKEYLEPLINKSPHRPLSYSQAIQEYIHQKNMSAEESTRLIHAATLIGPFDDTADLDELSATQAGNFPEESAGPDYIMYPDAYDSVVEFLSRNLEIRLNQQVQKLYYHQTTHTIQIHTATDCFESDYVISTLPLHTLKLAVTQGMFEPALRRKKLEAMNRLGYGLYNKIYLRLNSDSPLLKIKAEWFDFLPSNEPPDYYEIMNYGMFGADFIIVFTQGKYARFVESLSDEEYIARILRRLNQAFPNMKIEVLDYVRTNWQKTKGGSYSYPGKNATGLEGDALVEPEWDGHLLFAGEACSTTGEPGTAHGAYATGLEAAEKITNRTSAQGILLSCEEIPTFPSHPAPPIALTIEEYKDWSASTESPEYPDQVPLPDEEWASIASSAYRPEPIASRVFHHFYEAYHSACQTMLSYFGKLSKECPSYFPPALPSPLPSAELCSEERNREPSYHSLSIFSSVHSAPGVNISSASNTLRLG